MTGGQTLVDPDAHSNTMSELRKRAQQLGVKGRSRMKKAELAEAVARKEMDTLSITSPQSAVQESTEQGVQSATQQVRTASADGCGAGGAVGNAAGADGSADGCGAGGAVGNAAGADGSADGCGAGGAVGNAAGAGGRPVSHASIRARNCTTRSRRPAEVRIRVAAHGSQLEKSNFYSSHCIANVVGH